MAEQQPTLLVTGASGHLGRRVLELLLEANTGPIIATTRSPDDLDDFAEQGVTVRYADFDEPASLGGAFAGADRLLLISTDATGVPGKRIEQHRAAVEAAGEAGVQHVIYTSLINPEPGSPVAIAPDHYATEQALEASTMGWTVLRNNVYMNTLIGGLQQALKMGGKLVSAAGDGKIGYVAREDCARAAAAALAAPFEGRRTLDITGPEAVSQADLAEIGTQVTGQAITYIPVAPGTLIDNMAAAGLPRPVAEMIASFDMAAAQGVLDMATSAVKDLTGRRPVSVSEFLAAQPESVWQVGGAE